MRSTIIAAVLLIPLSAQAQPESGSGCKGPVRLATTRAELLIDWCGEGGTPASNARVDDIRITEDTAVSVRVINFNYLHYTLKPTVEATPVETYITLDKLWKQVFGVIGLGKPGAALEARPGPLRNVKDAIDRECHDIDSCLSAWQYMAGGINSALDRTLRRTTRSQVNAAEKKFFEDEAALSRREITACELDTLYDERLECATARLDAMRDATRTRIAQAFEAQKAPSAAQLNRYEALQGDHLKLLDRLEGFREGVRAIAEGRVQRIGKQKVGHIVTVTLEAKSASPLATDTTSFEIEYFVHSRFPMHYHVGYSYSTLDEFDFEKVRALDGSDLFSVVKSNENTNAMAAFMSYEVYTWPRADEPKVGFLATLGTDFTKPGDRLYFGASVRVRRRVLITGGVASATVKEGVNPVIEDLGAAVGARELFMSVGTRRDWKPFVGISFGVF